MNREKGEARLNQVAEQWATLPPEDNGAARQALYEEMFTLAFQLYDRSGEMWVVDAFEKAIHTFEPGRGPFSHYLVYLMSGREKNAYRSQARHSPAGESMDAPLGGDGPRTLGETIPADAGWSPEYRAEWSAPLVELTSMILNFAQCHRGRSANENRRNWYRIFYTEDMTEAMKSVELHLPHQREVFAAMKESYLNYYMSAPCTTEEQVRRTPLRPYGQVVPQRAGDERETPVPIPADVSLSYLRLHEGIEVGDSARSNQLKAYRQEKELIFRG